MSQQTVSPNGVHLAGSFQGWDPSTTLMTNLGNGLYCVSLDLAPGYYEFKFVNGNAWGPDEIVPNSCGVDNGLGGYNRFITVGIDNIILETFCFGQCFSCNSGQSYYLNGSAASLGGDCYRITDTVMWQNGTVWYANQLDLMQPFALQFSVNLGDEDVEGADGIVFVLQRVGVNAIGVSGGGMGFQSFGTSVGIEFDTYENWQNTDPAYDHFAIAVNGGVDHLSPSNLAGPTPISSTSNDVEDDADHVVEITWDPSTLTISVYFDCVFRLSTQNDFINSVFAGQSMVYWGFTGATGGLFNEQQICLQPHAIQINELTICPGGSVVLSGGSSMNNTYSWSPISFLDDPTMATPTATPDTTITYSVMVTDLCNVSISREVTVIVLEDNIACSILPVQWIWFDAQSVNGFDLLKWKTDGTSNGNFLIEASEDGQHWDFVSMVSSDLSNALGEGEAIVVRPRPAVYYRIAFIDVYNRMDRFEEWKFLSGSPFSELRSINHSESNSLSIQGVLRSGIYSISQYGCSVQLVSQNTVTVEDFIEIECQLISGLNAFVVRDSSGNQIAFFRTIGN